MRYFRPSFARNPALSRPSFATWSLAKRMLFIGIPLLGCVFVIFFGIIGTKTQGIVQRAISSNAHMQDQALGHELERLLNETRDQLLILAAGTMNQQDLARRLKIRSHGSEKARLRELAFLGVTPENRFLLLNYGGEVINIPMQVARDTRANPFKSFAVERRPGYVVVGQPLEVTYSLVPLDGVVQSLTIHVLRMTTPVYEDGVFVGLLILSLDLGAARDSLSLFSSAKSPVAPENEAQLNVSARRSLFLDPQGWVLFQSESLASQNPPLSTDSIRSGLRGDFGRPDFSIAFRPNVEHEGYWAMVSEMQAGRSSQVSGEQRLSWTEERTYTGILSFAPVLFRGAPDAQAQVVGGVATLDNSGLALRTAIKLWILYGMFALAGLIAVGGVLYFVGRRMAEPCTVLADAIREQTLAETPTHLQLRNLPLELHLVRTNVDALLDRVTSLHEDALVRQEALNAQWQRQPAQLYESPSNGGIADFVGDSLVMQDLRLHIAKAASVCADVLIVGETGTGKEMVSDAIHLQSTRSSSPFISINCGALDENLLMDTLFGHVKGAFTEARTDRKGAFLAAEGGTLMLDEVGNAAPKVQQALLRALSTRRIRPLGSDQETPFDVRIIAATNVDLLHESRNGTFREDLYYRLAVITIRTPPLRDHKSDIPSLASAFLSQAAKELGRPQAMLSKGALDRLINYAWPGNVRELKNILTRAMTFTEGDLIYAENIVFGSAPPPTHNSTTTPRATPSPRDVQPVGPLAAASASSADVSDAAALTALDDTPAHEIPPAVSPAASLASAPASPLNPEGLNRRQEMAFQHIKATGSITRQEYQELVGGDISMRTAQYDLQEMINRNLLRKEGRGPASRYVYVG